LLVKYIDTIEASVLSECFGFPQNGDLLARIHTHDSKATDLFRLDVHHRHGEVGALILVESNQITIILLIDVVSRKDQQIVGTIITDEVTILIKRIGRASIPILV